MFFGLLIMNIGITINRVSLLIDKTIMSCKHTHLYNMVCHCYILAGDTDFESFNCRYIHHVIANVFEKIYIFHFNYILCKWESMQCCM